MRILLRIGLSLGLCSALGLAACSPPVKSDNIETASTNVWQLINDASHLNFISIKKGTVVENHSFSELSGSVNAAGDARILIALDSVQTNIDIRNERMRTYLFETNTTPTATLTTKLDMTQFADMKIGARQEISATIVVHMHGKTESLGADMIVTRLGANKIAVESREPILVHIDSFGMTAGVEKLRELAKLPSITPVVPISFSLVFER